MEAYSFGAASRLFYVLNLFAGIADAQGKSDLALYAQTSTLYHATAEVPNPSERSHLAGLSLGRRAGYAAAQEDLRQAESLAPGVTDRSERVRLAEEIALARGVLAEQTNLEVSAAWLEKTIRLSKRTGDRFVRLVALKARAEALRKMGRVESAVADLKSAMATYDAAIPDLLRKQGGNPSERYRLTYLRQNADLYQAMISLRGRSPRAVEGADPGRPCRCAPGAGAVPALSLAEARVERWRRALPKETGLLIYGSVGQRIVAWVLTPAGRRFFWLGRSERAHSAAREARSSRGWQGLGRSFKGGPSASHLPLVRVSAPSEEAAHRPQPRYRPCALCRPPGPRIRAVSRGDSPPGDVALRVVPAAERRLSETAVRRRHGLVVGAPNPTRRRSWAFPLFASQSRQPTSRLHPSAQIRSYCL